MAARVCASCWVSLPKVMMECPVCARPTVLDPAVIEPEEIEWKTRVAELIEIQKAEASVYDEDEVMRQNRTRRLLEKGLPFTQAAELAIMRGKYGGFQVDVHEFEHMVDAGCSAELAAEILR